MPASKTPAIYALLVGINEYVGAVNPLTGCVQDVRMLATYLRERYGDGATATPIPDTGPTDFREDSGRLHLRVLTNAAATYPKILRAFREHFVEGGGTASDTFWLHFSGHGTQAVTAYEFRHPRDAAGRDLPSLEPNGKDQCVLAFHPAGASPDCLLADKELAALLVTLVDSLSPVAGEEPHLVVSLDCCHSGTGTREATQLRSRQFDWLRAAERSGAADRVAPRKLDSYLGGYYQRQLAEGKSLSVPRTRHILLSACTKRQQAGDLPEGGIFSSSLFAALNAARKDAATGTLSYADLYRETRRLALARNRSQSPQFEPVGGFPPHLAFLDGWSLGNARTYEVSAHEDKWLLGAGAVHGLPVTAAAGQELRVRVFRHPGREAVGEARVSNVGVQRSTLEPLGDLEKIMVQARAGAGGERSGIPGIAGTDAGSATANNGDATRFVAEVHQLPAVPYYVEVTGATEAAVALRDSWHQALHPHDADLDKLNVFLARQPEGKRIADLRIELQERTYRVLHLPGDRLVSTGKPNNLPARAADSSTGILKDTARTLARWSRLWDLEHKDNSLEGGYELDLFTLDYQQWRDTGQAGTLDASRYFAVATRQEDSVAELALTPEAFITLRNASRLGLRVNGDSVLLALRLHSRRPNLNYYLYHFTDDGGIELLADHQLDRPTDPAGLTLLGPLTVSMTAAENSSFLRLKLLVTQRPLRDKALLVQAGVNSRDRAASASRRPSGAERWSTQNILLTLKRQ